MGTRIMLCCPCLRNTFRTQTNNQNTGCSLHAGFGCRTAENKDKMTSSRAWSSRDTLTLFSSTSWTLPIKTIIFQPHDLSDKAVKYFEPFELDRNHQTSDTKGIKHVNCQRKSPADLPLTSTELLLHITMATLHLGFPAPVEKKPKPVAAPFGSR